MTNLTPRLQDGQNITVKSGLCLSCCRVPKRPGCEDGYDERCRVTLQRPILLPSDDWIAHFRGESCRSRSACWAIVALAFL